MMAHTPGPWRQYGDGSGIGAGEYLMYVAVVATREVEDWKANARLIAAAPDLLDTLLLFLGDNGHETMCRGHFKWVDRVKSAINCSATCDRLRAAIAKAEGREP